VVGLGEVAPNRRLHAEQGEEVGGHVRTAQTLRRVVDSDDKRSGEKILSQSLERSQFRRDLQDIRRREAEVTLRRPAWITHRDTHQPVRFGEWQPAQQGRIHDAELSGHAGNAERQREHRHEGETRILQQQAQAITQILKHFVLQSFGLQPELIPERAGASPQQVELVSPVEPIPLVNSVSRWRNSASHSRRQSARSRRGTITPTKRISQSQKRKRVFLFGPGINLTHWYPHKFLTCVFPAAYPGRAALKNLCNANGSQSWRSATNGSTFVARRAGK